MTIQVNITLVLKISLYIKGILYRLYNIPDTAIPKKDEANRQGEQSSDVRFSGTKWMRGGIDISNG